jgi:tRNA nucleotidyltransferase (CCA-adding enzyme)
MSEPFNLAAEIEKQLPAELVEFMQEAGILAAGQGRELYLVGGVVRDLLLKRPNLDIDLVVRGNAVELAKQLAAANKAAITVHPRFQTATLKWDKWRVDLATARSEHYTRPGALPTVHAGDIDLDLARRDFTINALAVWLIPNRWGEVIDLYNSREDLEKGLVRILHEDSFIDDATRIWRALRYEQRLGFKIEPKTLRLLKRDTGMMETISADRVRHELELILKEEFPEKVIRRADSLKVLAELHPALRGDAWLARKFKEARRISGLALPDLYLALLAYRLTGEEIGKLISRLKLGKLHARVLTGTSNLKAELEALDEPILQPSCIYTILIKYNMTAITASLLAADSPAVRKNIKLFLDKLRQIKPALSGSDLQKMGIPRGPEIKAILQVLLDARLDGEVKDRKGEEKLVEEWVHPAQN